jgi:YD repeat-containing protein
VKVSIGDRVGDGFRVSGRQIGIVPLDVATQTPGVVTGDAVLFANSDKDADHIVRVTPGGAESLIQLRSVDSPQRFRYRIDLPNDGALRLREGGSIDVSREGHRVGTIAKPIAWDASHQPIPVITTLRANVLVLEVAHRGRDIRYPAIVDPSYTDLLQYRWDANDNVNSKTNTYWSYQTNVSDKLAGSFNTTNVGGAANGLYSISRGAQVLYGGSYGYWRFKAPGTTSVAQVEWTHLSHSAAFAGGPTPCIGYGILQASTQWATANTECSSYFAPAYRRSCLDCNDTDGFDYNANVTGAQFGTEVYTATAANLSDFLGQATVYLVDIDNPSVIITSQPPTTWTNSPTGTITATATDEGLGVQSIYVNGSYATAGNECLYAGPCNREKVHPVDIATRNLPDGDNSIKFTAYDPLSFAGRDASGNKLTGQHEGSATAHVKVDRSPPVITSISGPLADAANATATAGASTLHVDATDGVSGGTDAQRRVGGKQVTVRVRDADGERVVSSPARTCATDSCELHEDITISKALLGSPGPKTIAITATDQLGHESDPAAHTLSVTVVDGLGEREQYSFVQKHVSSRLRVGVNVANGNLLVREVDFEIAESGLDLTQPRYYNSQSTTTGAYGSGWTGIGRDLRVTTLADGSVRLDDASGYGALFSRRPDGSFITPRGTDGELQRVGSGYRMTRFSIQDTLDFPLNGPVLMQTDVGGKSISYDYRADGTQSGARHSDGSSVAPVPDASGRTTSITTPVGTHEYVYQSGRLVTHTDPSEGDTTYTYDSATALLRTVNASDAHMDVDYDTSGRVASLTTRGAPSSPASTITFAYPSPGVTVVTDASGASTTYNVDQNAFVTLSRTGANPPPVELSGTLKDNNGKQLSTGSTYALQILGRRTGTEALSNISASLDDGVELDADINCMSSCMQEARTLSFHTDEQARGEHTIRASVSNSAGGETTRSIFVKTESVPEGTGAEDPGPTEEDAIEHDKSFRSRFGLNADDAHVRAARTDPAAQANVNEYGSPLYPSEVATMDERAAVTAKLGMVEEFGHTVAPDSYAGYYVDHANGGLIYVGFTTAGLSRFDELKQSFPYPDKLRVFTAQHAETQLNATLNLVNAVLDELSATVQLASVRIDYERNEVVIGLPDPTPIIDAQLKLRFGPIAIVEEHVQEYGRGDYRARVEAGLKLSTSPDEQSKCSSGFTARGLRKIGRPYYRLTLASHCGEHEWYLGGKLVGRTITRSESQDDVDSQVISLTRKRTSDKIWFDDPGPGTDKGYSRRIDHVESIADEERRGNIVCHSGQREVDCGTLADRDVSACYSIGEFGRLCFKHLRRANGMESKPGDSGGPVYRKMSKDRAIAVGLVSGGPTFLQSPIGTNDYTLYSHAQRIENYHQIALCTKRQPC